MSTNKSQYSEWAQRVWALRGGVGAVVALTLVIGVLGFMPTLYMMEVYDRVVNSRSWVTLAMLSLLAVGVYAWMEWLEKLRAGLLWGLGLRLEQGLQARVLQAMTRALLQRAPGGVSAMEDLRSLRETLNNPGLTAWMDLPMSLLCLALLWLISPWLAGAALLGGALQTALAWALQRWVRPWMARAQQETQAAQSQAESAWRNAQVMQAMGMLGAVRAQYLRLQHTFLLTQARASNAGAALNTGTKLLQQLMGSVLLGLACALSLEGALHGGDSMLIIASVLGGKLLQPWVMLVQQWGSWVSAQQAWARLSALLAAQPAGESPMALPAPQGHLQVEALSVAPPGQPRAVLHGLQFALEPGQVLVVVGPSASGKSTLARALVGLSPPLAGAVRLDGADVQGWDRALLGPHVGYMPQGVDLIEGTLAENVARFGEPDAQALQQACDSVGLGPLLAQLPQGLNTPLGPEGAWLSGGQRQRVALARAVYGAPKLVVLDEPNASLDEAGDVALVQTLQRLKAQGATVVVMSHRTSVLAAADRMLLLIEGRQQLFGPTAEVMARLQGGSPARVAANKGVAA